MNLEPFRIGSDVVAVAPDGRIMRRLQVRRIALRYFETNDGSKWRVSTFGLAVRVPEAEGAPTLRHATKDDDLIATATVARENVERYRAPVVGVSPKLISKAARMLGVGVEETWVDDPKKRKERLSDVEEANE